MANLRDCNIMINEVELQSRYYYLFFHTFFFFFFLLSSLKKNVFFKLGTKCQYVIKIKWSFSVLVEGNAVSPLYCPVDRGCRIHQLSLCRVVRPPPTHTHKCPGYDANQSDVKASVMLELWGIRNTTSLPWLPDLLGPRIVAPDMVLSIGQIELFDHLIVCEQVTVLIKLFVAHRNTLSYLTLLTC